MEQVGFKDLTGNHWLSGVDFIEWDHPDGVAQTCIFELDGVRYVAKEDPQDGYRSCMGELIRNPGEVKNSFKACHVVGVLMIDSNTDVISFQDADTGLEVLRIGTHNTDDYYPSFVANFQPEHMSAFVADKPAKKRKGKQSKKAETTYPEWGNFS